MTLLGLALGRQASAEPKKAECATAYEKSQELRASGKLTSAEQGLAICADDACPAFVRTDCKQWLDEVRRELPTVVFSVKDKKGEDATAVTVTMDGEPFATEVTGKSVPVDPGTHKFGFELDGNKTEREVTVRKSEKDREVFVSFAPAETDAPAPDPYGGGAKDAAQEPAGDATKPGPLRPFAYVAGGVGVAGIAGFVILGAVGKSKQSELDDSCGKTHSCAQSDVDSIKTKYVLADVSLGVGIAGLGAGVALFVLSMPKQSSAKSDDAHVTQLGVRPLTGGGVATVGGTF